MSEKIEERLAHLERLADELSDQVAVQAGEIERLERRVRSDICGVAIITVSLCLRRGSPGFGVSSGSASNSFSTGRGTRMPYFAMISRASA